MSAIIHSRPGVDQVYVDEEEHCQDRLEQQEALQQPPELLRHCSGISKREPRGLVEDHRMMM